MSSTDPNTAESARQNAGGDHEPRLILETDARQSTGVRATAIE